VQQGPWTRYHSTGEILDEGAFRDGHKTGQWRTYDAAGRLTKTRTYP
jgi:antitoxin component YwqK of YwqJK toxin-antitoxin module